ncbi:MAG: hypothetical protein BHV60_01365 [Bifidobacterium bifidum]|nr:MAG: hypothetical protein BHV60_01365 [Bifidobacterium bifidum]
MACAWSRRVPVTGMPLCPASACTACQPEVMRCRASPCRRRRARATVLSARISRQISSGIRDASDGAPDGCRRLIGGILAGQRRFAVCLLLVAQRVGERHGRLSDQRLRVGWGEVLVVVGYLRLFRRRIERDPAVAFEIDLHPCFDVVAGEFDGRGAVDRFGAVVAAVLILFLFFFWFVDDVFPFKCIAPTAQIHTSR